MRAIRKTLGLAAAEDGSLLIEVMVGAVVLAITSTAVLNGLDGAQETGLRNKQRSVSSTLAQQDIERLRAFPITSLSNYRETRTVDVQGVDYTVASRTDWVRDASGLVSCTSNSTQAEYLQITSTVAAPDARARPVKEVSLLTPAPGAFSTTAGTVAVKLTERTGNPHAGVQVSLSGPGSFSGTTNELGCAIFGFIPQGIYEIEVPGLVGWGGESGTSLTVAAGQTSLRQLEMERPASLRAHFELPPGAPTGTPTARWTNLTVSNAKLPGGAKTFAAGSPVPSIDGDGLFPFLDGYGAYAGTCRANNPAFWQPTYFQTSGKGFVLLDPGDLLKSVQVQMGTLRVNVANSLGDPVDALVTVRGLDTGNGCTASYLAASRTGGQIDFVLPFGTYRICASLGNRRRETTANPSPVSATTPRHVRLAPPNSQSGPPSSLVASSAIQLPTNTSNACSLTP